MLLCDFSADFSNEENHEMIIIWAKGVNFSILFISECFFKCSI